MIEYTLARVYLHLKGIPKIPYGTAVTIVDTYRQEVRSNPYSTRPTKDLRPTDRIQVRSEAGYLAWVDAEHLEMTAP